jgi:hypothetical protein
MAYNPNKNYVGPQGKWFKNLIPRKPLGVDFNYPSYNHDKSYASGINKRVADLAYLYDCMALVENKDWQYLPNTPMRLIARQTALIYFICVRDFGKMVFERKKNERN